MSLGRLLCTDTPSATFGALADRHARLTIREHMASAEILAAMKAMGMDAGWSQSLDRLHAELRAMAT